MKKPSNGSRSATHRSQSSPGRHRLVQGVARSRPSLLSGFRWSTLQLGPFQWRAIAAWRAARVAVGVVLPLILGWASGRIEDGAFAALGALPAGFASFQGVSRSRLAAIVVASVGMAVSTFVGATTAATLPWLLVPVVIVWAYVAGLVVCLGPRLSVAVLQWSVGLLIAVGLPLGPAGAAVRAGFVLAGGLFQAALVAGSWIVWPGQAERAALAESYRALAEYASSLAAGRFGPPSPVAFPATNAFEDPNPLLPLAARLTFVDLLEEAERIRAALAALAAHAASAPAGDAREIRKFAGVAARILDDIVGALGAGRAERAARVSELSRRAARLTVSAGASWRWAGEALLGQVRAVAGILARLDALPTQSAVEGAGTVPIVARADGGVTAVVATLRANLTLATEAGRHALRVAVVAGVAEVLVQATGLSVGRWVVLTIFIVLKPDYSSTLSRSIQRAVGTVLGVGLSAAAVQLGHLDQGGLFAAAGISIAAAYALFEVNYLLFSGFITAFIVMLLDILGIPAIPTAEARLIDTAIGAVLALTAYVLWPTWEGGTAPEKLARLIEAHREYAVALLRQIAHPKQLDLARLRALQGAARRARSDAEASTARLVAEPAQPPLTPPVAIAVMAAVGRLAHEELALHSLAVSPSSPTGEADGESEVTARRVDALAAALSTTMSHLAVSLRTLKPPLPIPALRPLQAALRGEPPLANAPFANLTDALVDAVNTLDAILHDLLRVPLP